MFNIIYDHLISFHEDSPVIYIYIYNDYIYNMNNIMYNIIHIYIY